ncbi:MAG TPA: hypothetical protein VEJ63_08860 [Planctomycetota bacterium]|nr:hypothetical protein [Planctomycetota bacterium]
MGLKAERKTQSSSQPSPRKRRKGKRSKAAKAPKPERKIYYITRATPEERARHDRIIADLEARGIIRIVHPKGTPEERIARLRALDNDDPAEQKETGRFLRQALKESGGVKI